MKGSLLQWKLDLSRNSLSTESWID